MLPITDRMKAFVLKYRYFLICILVLLLIILFLGISNINNQQQVVQYNEDNIENFTQNSPQSTKNKSDVKARQQDNNQPSKIYVDIKGAVKRPDLYEMKGTDRMKQLLDKAGVQHDADLNKINLSEKLVDQRLIYIPKKGESATPSLLQQIDESNENKTRGDEKVNLNLATESELQKVPGIGTIKANAIIAFRTESGAFKVVDDLKKVNGIGPKTFEKLKEYFIV